MNYYAALLPRRGPHIASHSVCLSVCLSVRPVIVYFTVEPSYERTSKIEKLLFSLMGQRHVYFSARTEGRISYGHLGRTNSCYLYRPNACRFNVPVFVSRHFSLDSDTLVFVEIQSRYIMSCQWRSHGVARMAKATPIPSNKKL